MTRSLLRPIRTRRIVRSSAPLPSGTSPANSITPGTRKTLAAIGALWVSFAVSASVNTASAKPVVSGQKAEPDYSRSILAAAPKISRSPSKSEAQGIVLITTGTPRPPKPEGRLLPADASTALAYLKSLSK